MVRKNKTPEQHIAELHTKKDGILGKYNGCIATLEEHYNEYMKLYMLKKRNKEYNANRLIELDQAHKDFRNYNTAISKLKKLTEQKTPPPTSNATISIAQCTSFSKPPDNVKVTATKSQFNITPNTTQSNPSLETTLNCK